jgi:hypothetical protein
MRRTGDKFKQHDASFTQTITSNELSQRACQQHLYIFGRISSLLINNPLCGLLSFGFVDQGH